MNICVSDNKRNWYKYLKPKQLSKEVPIYRWLFWNITLDKEEYRDKLHKEKGQNTFVYCMECGTELISSECFIKDTDYVYYKCSLCGTETKWDFDFPCPILVAYRKEGEVNWKPYTKNNLKIER